MSGITLHVSPGTAMTASVGSDPIELRPKERVVAAALALHHPGAVALPQLIALVWPDGEPATAKQSIHNHLARLRTAVPGLVESNAAGYVLGDGVSILVEGPVDDDVDDTDYLVEFGDLPEVRRARTDFVRRHVSVRRADPTAAFGAGDTRELVASLEEKSRRHPGDERSWWLLAIATTQLMGIASGSEVIRRARRAMNDAGLGLGRRLLDLQGMLGDGVDDVHVLLRNPFGSSGDASVDPLGDDLLARLADVRQVWTDHERFVICVRGPDHTARRAVLARIVDDARASGFSTAFARHLPGDIGPPTLRSTHRGTRPIVMVIDGFDNCDDPTRLAARVADRLPTDAVGWVVAESADGDVGSSVRCAGADDSTPTHVIDVPDPEDAAITDRASVERVGAGTLHLLRLLAAIGEPIIPDHLTDLAPGAAAAALDAARAGLARVDAATHTVDLASNAVAEAALSGLDADGRRTLAMDLLDLELPALDEARRSELRSRWSIVAHGATDDRTIAYTREAANAYSLRGEFDVAAAVIHRTLELIAEAEGRSARWCRLAIRAGQAMLAGGEPAGDELLSDVVAAAVELDDSRIAADATHEWCRLGMAGGAGSTDAARFEITSQLLARLTDPADRARVGAAAAMVLSLGGDPELLRDRFDDAVADAASSGDASVMADVLPLAYMSISQHSDIDLRLEHAGTLSRLADELDRPDSRWEALQLRYSSEVMRGDPGFRATLTELREVAEELHERSREWEMHFIRSNLALLDGDIERARREVDESLAFGGQVNPDRVAAVFGAHHLVASMIEGSAAGLLETLRELATDQPGIDAWHAAHAVAAAAAGEVDEAIDALAELIVDGELRLLRDPVYTAGLVAIGEAAAATRDPTALALADAALEPLAGTWSWCGSCTFGPIDLTRARVAAALGDMPRAERLAADAVVTCADMRAPVFAQQATDLLLSIATA